MTQASFMQKINNLLKEMNAFKIDPIKNKNWKPEFDDLYDSIVEIADIGSVSEATGEEMFSTNVLSQYNNFSSYVYVNSNSAKSLKHNEVIKAKSTRINHKKMRCPKCGAEVPPGKSTTEYICGKCGYIGEIKIKGPVLHSVADSSKHVCKLFDKLLGICKPTKHIAKLLNIMIAWLTNKKYLYQWLVHNGNITKWMEKYNKAIEPDYIEPSKFFQNMIVERTEDNILSPDEFKVYTDELYDMLNYFKKLHESSTNNMMVLDDQLILDIIIDYLTNVSSEVPALDYIHEYNDEKYELGHYITYLSLIVNNEIYPLKGEIEELFDKNLTQPGLMFNFVDIKGETSIKFPSKFQYSQEYPWFIRMIFNAIPPIVSDKDEKYIIDLILAFNNFYKVENKTEKNKECNAPLFVCVLDCIIRLHYFRKYYDGIARLLPKKQNHTSSNITRQWQRFMLKNPNLIRPFRTDNPEELLPQSTLTTSLITHDASTTDNEDNVNDTALEDDLLKDDDNELIGDDEDENNDAYIQQPISKVEFKDDDVI